MNYLLYMSIFISFSIEDITINDETILSSISNSETKITLILK